MPSVGEQERAGRNFWIALGLFVILGVLAWCTLGRGTVLAFGRPVELRVFPLFVLAMFAVRTVVAHEANKIRRQKIAEDGVRDPE